MLSIINTVFEKINPKLKVNLDPMITLNYSMAKSMSKDPRNVKQGSLTTPGMGIPADMSGYLAAVKRRKADFKAKDSIRINKIKARQSMNKLTP